MICRAISAAPQRDRNFFLALLQNAINLSQLNQIHAQIILTGHSTDLATLTKLTHKLFDVKAVSQAKLLFASLANQISPDKFLYNELIRGFSQNGSPLDSIAVYSHLRRKTDMQPDKFTYSFVVPAVASSGFQKVGILLHGHVLVSGCGSDVFVGSALVDMYMSFSRTRDAFKVFEKTPERDGVLWNTMVSGMVKNFFFHEAVCIFHDMVVEGVKFDSTTLAMVLTAVAELKELRAGMMIHCLAMKVGFHLDNYVLTGLISFYSKCGDVSSARWLFGLIRNPDLVSYNAMISAFSCNEGTKSAVELFKELLNMGKKVNSSTIVGLIPVSRPFGHLNLAKLIHGFCIKSSDVLNSSVSTALVTVYNRLSEIESVSISLCIIH
ncbi:OLC1v1035485C1 [Oldenlandia corymbosa var. corymbosa]|uniref:OLC1v1035485C1 n=1 Tax=Oldenlandia corymbosa var. corymbosa TaxID=529605 RepID=A0AAV1CT27_OLDCO|nr:OLC1v1035485C1 [Oldenlandia corymbosa var. corymbosa]